MTTDELSALLSNLHDELSREYELSLTKLTGQLDPISSEAMLLELIEKNLPEQTRDNAFYCLSILYRRQKDYFKLKELLDKYKYDIFDLHPSFSHLESLYDLESDSLYDYDKMLRNTYRDALDAPNNAGFVHLFADAFATIYEKGGIHNKDAFLEKWYQRANTEVDNAIRLDPSYAKYYCTKARILRIKGDFGGANLCIDKAISMESSDRSDYPLRIGNYQYHKMLIYTEMRMKELEQNLRAEYSALHEDKLPPETVREKVSETLLPEGLAAYLGKEPFVFISYAHADAARVYPILKLLQDRGVRLWFDINSIPAGQNYDDYIGYKVAESSIYMPFITATSLNSRYIRREMDVANDYHKPFCSIFLENLDLTPGALIRLGHEQRINWYTNDIQSNLDLIIRSLPPMVFHNAQN